MKKYIPVLLCGVLLGCSSSESVQPKPSFEVFAADAYYDSYKKESWPDLHNLLGDEGIARLKDLDPKAVKIAYKDPLCNKIEYNGVSMSRSSKDEIVLFVDCVNPSNEWKPHRVYVFESEVKAAEAAKTQP